MTMVASGLDRGLLIREYASTDLDQVWELHLEGVRQTRSQYIEVDSSAYEKDLHAIEATYLSGGTFLVVESKGKLIGMTAVQRIDEHTGRLRRMRVTEAWRRKGIARALLEAAEDFCRNAGFSALILDTMEQQTAAQALYQRSGFTKTGERDLGPFRVYDYRKGLG